MRSGASHPADSRKSHPKYLLSGERRHASCHHASWGVDIRIGSLLPEITEATEIKGGDGSKLTLEPIQCQGNRLMLDGFDPCAVLLNNDLSTGVPAILQDLEQVLIPP